MGEVHLYLAPAVAGKTAYVLGRVRAAAARLEAMPRVVVPTRLQVRSWRRRLAEGGGVIGACVQTFDDLYRECLNAAGEVYTELSEAAQYQLLQAVVERLDLRHYAPLTDRPGFIRLLQGMIGELKAGMIWPETLAEGVATLGSPSRLVEVAQIYQAYQSWLQTEEWADSAGLGWLAVAALRERVPDLGRQWPLLVVDGFDDLTPAQLALLEMMVERVGTMIVTLTGQVDGRGQRLVHRRFDETRDRLEAVLGVRAEPLPELVCSHADALVHLERGLFSDGSGAIDGSGVVDMVAAPDRVGEVRAALRWLKARVIQDGMRPEEVALLARNLGPYRESIGQIAAEFGMPVRLMDGLSLQNNPAVAALLGLLRLMAPRSAENPEFALPRRGVVEAWRSPYFDWNARAGNGAAEPVGIESEDEDVLDAVARWGRVVGGRSQWEEVLDGLVKRVGEQGQEEDDRGLPLGIPVGEAAPALRAKFSRFVQCLEPPAGVRSLRSFALWLDDLIGTDMEDAPHENAGVACEESRSGLEMVGRICEGAEEAAERDLAALAALKRVLRGMLWVEQFLGSRPTDYAGFLHQLAGAVEATRFQLAAEPDREEILVADVVQARGVPFRAVAILGLAEGEFPGRLTEDPLLPDADRRRLRADSRLPLRLSVESAEAEYFYEALTRAREQVLLTRPRLDDSGVLWQPSPFWEEVARLSGVAAVTLLSESVPRPNEAASWPELVESLVVERGSAGWRWMAEVAPARQAALEHAAEVFRMRSREKPGGAYDGDLTALTDDLAIEFGPGSNWSASRLESYRACPFQFLVTNLMELAPREEPVEGLDARQLGNIYHRILERLYQAPEVEDPTNPEQLVAALERVAGEILDGAPEREGFRETAWWKQTRTEIVQNVQRSLEALGALPDDLVPMRYEVVFGVRGAPALVIRDGDDSFCLRGLIDRVDRSVDGRLRVIDYKTSHPAGFDDRAIADGTKLQLPLYALAARDALQLGEPVEGFYWHVRHAEPSRFTLGDFPGGPEQAFEIAVEKAWEAIASVRRGLFAPHPPEGGCPPYCPAGGFCWQWDPGRRGGR